MCQRVTIQTARRPHSQSVFAVLGQAFALPIPINVTEKVKEVKKTLNN